MSGDIEANPGFALGQLARALTTSADHHDPEVRERARAKVATWRSIFEGMVRGALDVGARTPVADTPAWATLEVAAGGFATGRLLAGGPLRPHELALLDSLGRPHDDHARAALNAHYLGDDGLAELRARLRDGTYRVEVPEEAALLVVAWLLDHGDPDGARAILDAIGPFLGTLRFYPVPHAEPEAARDRVHVQPVAVTARQLEGLRERPRILAEREAAQVWAPLVDRLVALVAETVADGWPCQHYADDWATRAREVVAEVARRRREPHRCGEVDRASSNLARLTALVTLAAADPLGLGGGDVGELRGILARVEARRGLPGSWQLTALRAAQASKAARPTRREQSRLVLARLAARPGDRGLDEVDALLAPPTDDEATRHHLPAGAALTPRLRPVLLRSLDAPIEELVATKVVGSAEALARVLPQLTAPVVAAGVRDPDLRRVHAALYQAFRRRRSLLLLWLQHQVKLEELPWAAAINATRVDEAAARLAARAALLRVVELALTSWPHSILPNKLLQEVRALAQRAGLTMPIVDEIAADIFMGELTEKFLRAAQRAARLVEGTIYATYYGVPCAALARLDDVAPSRFGAPVSPGFYGMCEARAGVGTARGVARNGCVLEQVQILTTHNLAVLIGGLGMMPHLAAQLPDLARRNFTTACGSLQRPGPTRKHRLRAVKNAAYAWRQMIFFLALAPRPAVDAFLMWAGEQVAALPPAFRARFGPAYAGLCIAAAGMTPGEATAPGARPLLGWTVGKHWLLDEA